MWATVGGSLFTHSSLQAVTNFAHSNFVHDMSQGSVDCAKAFGPASVALAGSFLLLPLRPAQVCAQFVRSLSRELSRPPRPVAGGIRPVFFLGGRRRVFPALLVCPWSLRPVCVVIRGRSNPSPAPGVYHACGYDLAAPLNLMMRSLGGAQRCHRLTMGARRQGAVCSDPRSSWG